jgi:lysophospholipase L1-like esterase
MQPPLRRIAGRHFRTPAVCAAVSSVAAALFLYVCYTSYGHASSPAQSAGAGPSCNCPASDWPSIQRFTRDDQLAMAQSAMARRVVFLGDSITEHWAVQRPSFFASHGFVGRGIYGQTTPQVVLRVRPDGIALAPQVIVILAGTNDLAGNTGPESLQYIEGNLASMVEIARANKIAVVLSSVLPVNDVYKLRTTTRKPADILELNRWMRQYCAAGACVYLDYFSHLIDASGSLRSELSDDGLHPNTAGYEIMEPLAEAAIGRAVRP